MLATLGVNSLGARAATAGDAAHKWPGESVPIVICDRAASKNLGGRICRRQKGRGHDPAVLQDREAKVVRLAIVRWNSQFGDSIRFRETNEKEPHLLVIRRASRSIRCSTQGNGFSSRQWLKFVSIGARCNAKLHVQGTNEGTVIHELMHGLGFYHEQQRADASRYIEIDRSARKLRRKAHQWARSCDLGEVNGCGSDIRTRALGLYDFGSIMHYSLRSGAVALTPAGVERLRQQGLKPGDIGQREWLSPLDAAAVRTLYPPRSSFGATLPHAGG